MENSQSERGDEMSFEQKISQDFNTYEQLGSRHQTFGKDHGSAFPRYRLVILSLVLLNVGLLITAVVIVIYCVKVDYLQVPNSAATPLIIEMNYLRNQSGIIRAKLEAQAAVVKERTSHVQLKLKVKQQRTITDSIQGQIETLRTEKTNLQAEKSILEESCGRCLPGWTFLKSSCYYFSSGNASNYKKNWPDSRADCIRRGADLLVITNLEEQILVSNSLPKQSTSSTWWENGFWIGLTDVATEGTWIWVNNVTEVEVMYWRNGQPNHFGPQSGNCAAVFQYSDTRKTWYNGNCQDHLFNWICEMEAGKI